MIKLFKLQFLGPLVVFVATLCSELAAQALSYDPSSELLWFVNLRLFGIFQRSYSALGDAARIPGFQLFALALPLFLLACYGLVARRRLPLALASNLSVGYGAFLLLAWQSPVQTTTQASLGPIAVPSGAGGYVLTGILGACVLSCAVSHLLYLCARRSEI
jgi:hypothetical protein